MKTTSSKIQKNWKISCGLLNIRSLSPKALLVNELISNYQIDVISLTETWLAQTNVLLSTNLLLPVIIIFIFIETLSFSSGM